MTLTPGEVTTLTVPVNTTLEVTLGWTGGGDDKDIDLAVAESYLDPLNQLSPQGHWWTTASQPGLWGTRTLNQSGATGTETYKLNFPHGDDAYYWLAVVFNGGTPAAVTVTVKQNSVVDVYTFTLTNPGWYYAYQSPTHYWPNWSVGTWNRVPGPYVF